MSSNDTRDALRFKVVITETLKTEVMVDAASSDHAEQIVADEWKHGLHILDADDFSEATFQAVGLE